jgi:hypothetical protein
MPASVQIGVLRNPVTIGARSAFDSHEGDLLTPPVISIVGVSLESIERDSGDEQTAAQAATFRSDGGEQVVKARAS